MYRALGLLILSERDWRLAHLIGLLFVIMKPQTCWVLLTMLLGGCASEALTRRDSIPLQDQNLTADELKSRREDFRLYADEVIAAEKKAIEAAKVRRAGEGGKWNDLDNPIEPQKSYVGLWLEYFKEFRDPTTQWVYGLRKGDEAALIKYIVVKRRALGLAEIKR